MSATSRIIHVFGLLGALMLASGCSLIVEEREFEYSNEPPQITSSPGDTTLEEINDSFFYEPVYTDADEPSQAETDPGYVTCEIVDNICGDWLQLDSCNASGTPDERDAPGSCSYIIRVTDGLGETAEQTVEITMVEGDNRPPVITIDCPDDVSENDSTQCDVLDASDPDFPADNLTCSVNVSVTTCTGVSITDCAGPVSIEEQGEAAGAGDCIVALTIEDGNGGSSGDQATLDILEENNDPEISMTCPSDLDEDASGVCTLDSVTDSDPTGDTLTCSLNTTLTTCTGVTVTDCSADVALTAQGESAGPGTCDVAVEVEDGNGGATTGVSTITINEVNQNPDVEISCPANISEGTASTCSFTTASDPDVPANTLTCSLNTTLTTCTGVTVTDCATDVAIAPQGEAAGPGSCVVAVDINDGVGGTDTDQVTIQVDEGNDAPTIALTCPASSGESTAFGCSATVADSDLPAQTLICSVDTSGSTCTGITVSSCSSITVGQQGEAAGPGSCDVAIIVNDGNGGTATDTQTVSITEENGDPTIALSCPANLYETSASSCSITATDPDPGPDTLTCSLNAGSTTCTGASVTGCSSVTVPAQGESAGPGSCVVAVNVSDGNGGTDSDSDSITIDEWNTAPSWSTAPSNISGVFPRDAYSAVVGVAQDSTDIPNSSSGDPGYITCVNTSDNCSFAVSVTGSGSGSASCNISFTAPDNEETCTVTVEAEDGYGDSVSQTIQVSIAPCAFRVADTGNDTTGHTWATAFNHPQDAVDTAWEGCEVWVKEGTYTRIAGAAVLTMADEIDVYGGFDGSESSLASRTDPTSHPTILDAEDIYYHAVVAASDTILDGFILTGGNASATSGSNGNGGGLWIQNMDNVTARNCIIENNSAYRFGGGIDISFSTNVLIEACEINGNQATQTGISPPGSGGGASIYNSDGTFKDCIFDGNASNEDWGGGLFVYLNATAVVENCLFINNVSVTGAAITTAAGSSSTLTSTTLQNVTITGNNATGVNGSPIAMLFNPSTMTITDSIIYGNTGAVGSIYYSSTNFPVVQYSDIDGWILGTNNIDVNPGFVAGTLGNYYLNQSTSQCVDAGSSTASSLGMDSYTTSTTHAVDTGTVDMGWHYTP